MARRWTRSAQQTLLTCGVVALLVVVNVLAARHSWRWDLTAVQAFSLSDTTRELLGRIEQPVHVYTFFEPASRQEQAVLDLLQEYQASSGGKIAFQRVNFVTQPSLVQKYAVLDLGTVVLEAGGRVVRVDPWELTDFSAPEAAPAARAEQAISSALLRLTQNTRHTIYFLEGHGERTANEELSQARAALEAEGYAVQAVNLAVAGQVPTDADLIAVVGPHQDLTEAEARLLEGRNLLVMVDPQPDPVTFPNLSRVLAGWGIRLEQGLVADPARSYMTDPATPIPAYGEHEITHQLADEQLAMVIPGARPLSAPGAEGYTATALLHTSEDAWAETDMAQGIRLDSQAERRGRLALAYAVEAAAPADGTRPARLVAAGSSAFIADDTIRVQGNMDFLLNTVTWAIARADGLIAVRPRPVLSRDMLLTARDLRMIIWGSVAAVPLMVLAGGGIVWWRRRHL